MIASEAHPSLALLRNVSVRKLIRALERDGFQFTERQGSQRIYRHPDRRRVVIHFHRPGDTLPPYVIRNFLIGTRWIERDLRRLGLVK